MDLPPEGRPEARPSQSQGHDRRVVGWDDVKGARPIMVRSLLQSIGGEVYSWKEHQFLGADGRTLLAVEIVSPEPKKLTAREAQEFLAKTTADVSEAPPPGEARVLPPSAYSDYKAVEPQYDPKSDKTSSRHKRKGKADGDQPTPLHGVPQK